MLRKNIQYFPKAFHSNIKNTCQHRMLLALARNTQLLNLVKLGKDILFRARARNLRCWQGQGTFGASKGLSIYFPMQNLEKIADRISSEMFVPIIFPNSLRHWRISMVRNSGETPLRKPSMTASLAEIEAMRASL